MAKKNKRIKDILDYLQNDIPDAYPIEQQEQEEPEAPPAPVDEEENPVVGWEDTPWPQPRRKRRPKPAF